MRRKGFLVKAGVVHLDDFFPTPRVIKAAGRVFSKHKERKAGGDGGSLQCIFLDFLDGFTVVVTRFELSDIRNIVDKPDRQAFITISEVTEIYGNHIKKKPKQKKKAEVLEKQAIS